MKRHLVSWSLPLTKEAMRRVASFTRLLTRRAQLMTNLRSHGKRRARTGTQHLVLTFPKANAIMQQIRVHDCWCRICRWIYFYEGRALVGYPCLSGENVPFTRRKDIDMLPPHLRLRSPEDVLLEAATLPRNKPIKALLLRTLFLRLSAKK